MAHEEHVERLLARWRVYGLRDILREDGTCDWQAVREAYAKDYIEERELWYVLLEKNILSTTLERNYTIIRNGHLWGPYFGWVGHLNFVRKEDAEGYFDNFYGKHGGLDSGHAKIIHCIDVQFRKMPEK